MTFTEWLSKLGEVITSFVGWVGSCFNSLQDNYIILTILGIALFFFVFNLILRIINYIHIKDPNNLDNYIPRHSREEYISKHSEEGRKLRSRG